MQAPIRTIAFYLPQYHPIAENNTWWGKGFTEWRGVARARPSFVGHYQPHIPGDLGFYDLRVPETRAEQAALAREYGIHGFCYYYYWFNGKRLLERPLNDMLASGEPDFPFCICWANENWTRVWDGGENHVLMAQDYTPGWEERFILDAIPTLADPRYIRINGKPLLIVYRIAHLPDPRRAAEIWRETCVKQGLGEIYIACMEPREIGDPIAHGFDASIEFPPSSQRPVQIPKEQLKLIDTRFSGVVVDYVALAQECLSRPNRAYPWYRTVMTSWDNTPRRGPTATVFVNSAPQNYARWLDGVVDWTLSHRHGDERVVFINAWNEWGEGCHLEPDINTGHAYLLATRDVLNRKALAARAVA